MGRKQPPVKSCQKCGRPLKGHRLPIGPSCGLEPDPHNLERNTEAKFRRRLALDHRRRQRPQHRDASMDKNQLPVKSCLKCGRPRKGHKLPIGPGCTLELDPHLLQKNKGTSSISSVTMATVRGEERGGAWLLPGLQCSVCAQPCSSHALLLAHTAAAHPIRLDRTAVGRLGNVIAYQETARLFHCSDCFFTCRDFSRLFTHLLTTHCSREEEEEEQEEQQGGPPEQQGGPPEQQGGPPEQQGGPPEQQGGPPEQQGGPPEQQGGPPEQQGGPPEQQGGPPEEQGGPPDVISYSQSRYVCVLCGWRTKLRGLALSHVVTVHRLEGRFSCSRCPSSFLLPAQLSQHLSLQHRPARYGCPYCPFTAHGLGAFRRHCQRCRGGAHMQPDTDPSSPGLISPPPAGGSTSVWPHTRRGLRSRMTLPMEDL
ncbi:chromosome alignment-maintaining phosphoprotein 1-like [Gadus chalcogrammus]|uniref:chromosome alignment-maintaining phosphoprotein 1-like n=1 Tax=Gadus chalcogrammus TaxID=1042646 RepID=UPI0024C20CE6|nr:chromosome alignment-maintaining phosphoprotein 1-like [Gadus chalcogrammus]